DGDLVAAFGPRHGDPRVVVLLQVLFGELVAVVVELQHPLAGDDRVAGVGARLLLGAGDGVAGGGLLGVVLLHHPRPARLVDQHAGDRRLLTRFVLLIVGAGE